MARPAFLAVHLVFVTLIAAPFTAACADWYVGASAGQSRIDASADEIEQAFLIDDDFVASGTTLDKTDVGWKAYVGYELFSMLAIEAGYADLGEAAFTTTIVDAPPPLDAITPFSLEGTATADGPQLSALLDVPLFGSFSAFARAGAMRWTAEFSEFIPDTGTTRVARTEDEIDALYGVGFQLKFSALAARLEWERIENVGEGIGGREGRDVDFVSAGVIFEF